MNTPYDEDYDNLWCEHAKKVGMIPRKKGNERWGVVAPDDWLRGLLLFDRIWIPWSIDVPNPISDKGSFCDYETDNEVLGRQISQRMNELRSMGRETEDIDWPNVDAHKALNELFNSGLKRSIRYVAELYSKKGYNVIPLYGISEQFQAEFTPGLQIAYEASFREISIVSPEHLLETNNLSGVVAHNLSG